MIETGELAHVTGTAMTGRDTCRLHQVISGFTAASGTAHGQGGALVTALVVLVVTVVIVTLVANAEGLVRSAAIWRLARTARWAWRATGSMDSALRLEQSARDTLKIILGGAGMHECRCGELSADTGHAGIGGLLPAPAPEPAGSCGSSCGTLLPAQAGAVVLAGPADADGHLAASGLTHAEIRALAAAYSTAVSAGITLRRAGIPPESLPAFEHVPSAVAYWTEVSRELEFGKAPGGRRKLLLAAAEDFPAHPSFQKAAAQPQDPAGGDVCQGGGWGCVSG
jgi:hypothetical protein